MTYFLDFDYTLFDADAFVAHLIAHAGDPPAGTFTEEWVEKAFAALSARGALGSVPNDLQSFLYPDVAPFFKEKGEAVDVITFGNPRIQAVKVENALATIPYRHVWYTGQMRKGEFMKEKGCLSEGNIIVVDDRPLELENLAAHCPSVQLYEMRRDGAAGDGRWPVVRSLNNLP